MAVLPAADITLPRARAGGGEKRWYRHPEVRAISAFTRVFDALWRASKDDGPSL